jgi:hypothetical protein
MPVFRIHRLRDAAQEQFRWAPHTSGATPVKPKAYQEDGQVEAPSCYAAWIRLREDGTPLRVGDLLENESGELRISKYVGFEEAQWVQPEPQPAAEGCPATVEGHAEGGPVA